MRLPAAALLLTLVSGALAIPGLPGFLVQKEGDVNTSNSWRWASCGSDDDVAQIESIGVSPDPPEAGKDLTITVKAANSEIIEEGAYADVLVKLGYIKLLQKRFDVCEEAEKADLDLQCPVAPGSHTIVHTETLPKEIPRGKFAVHVEMWTADEDPVACVNIFVDFLPKRPF